MSRLESITPEEMPEVVRIATRIREEELAQAAESQERQAFVDAAAEMDLPQSYLERAAVELDQTRILQSQNRVRRRSLSRRIALGVGTTAVAIGILWNITHRPPPLPNVYHFTAQEWRLNYNPGTAASVSFTSMDGRSNVADIHVDRFVPRPTDGQYFVNLDSMPSVNSFSGYNTTSFFVKAAGLSQIRLYLEASDMDRWRSPAVTASGDWQQQTIDLTQYQHQVRDTPSSQWHNAANDHPGHINTLSFKAGSFMNDAAASGDVAIDDLEIR